MILHYATNLILINKTSYEWGHRSQNQGLTKIYILHKTQSIYKNNDV